MATQTQFQVDKRETSITILPEEMIFNILTRLPAHVLYNEMRYVCRQWRRIIEDPQFVNTHYLLATSTTLLMYSQKTSLYYLLDVTECCAKLSGFEFCIPSEHEYRISTCNGLMLFRPVASNCTYYVGNPITHRALALPRLSFHIVYCGLAFEASSQVYKVVVVYRTEKWSKEPYNLDIGCAILTVGIDNEWRFLDYPHLMKEDMRLFNRRPPITCTDFVYWVPISEHYMLALDLKSETIKRISLPLSDRSTQHCKYLAKGNSISVWYPNTDYSMEVWLLKDYICEEWVKVLCINGEPIRNELCKVMPPHESTNSRNIHPRSWYGKRILFDALCMNYHLFVYDLKTCGCCEFDLENGKSFFSSLPRTFVNSLTWGC